MTESTLSWQTRIAYRYTWKRFQNRCEWSACFHGEFSLWCSNSKAFCDVHLHCNQCPNKRGVCPGAALLVKTRNTKWSFRN